jgi:hypothetical protein
MQSVQVSLLLFSCEKLYCPIYQVIYTRSCHAFCRGFTLLICRSGSPHCLCCVVHWHVYWTEESRHHLSPADSNLARTASVFPTISLSYYDSEPCGSKFWLWLRRYRMLLRKWLLYELMNKLPSNWSMFIKWCTVDVKVSYFWVHRVRLPIQYMSRIRLSCSFSDYVIHRCRWNLLNRPSHLNFANINTCRIP